MDFCIEEQMWRLGLQTYVMSIYTPVTAIASLNIAKQMPTQMGWIYGLSVYTDQVTPDGIAQITMANAQNLYLILKEGKENNIEVLRLDDLVFTSTQNIGCNQRYYPVNINAPVISLDQSSYENPTAITTGQIQLNMYYLSKQDVDYLRSCNYLGKDGKFTGVTPSH